MVPVIEETANEIKWAFPKPNLWFLNHFWDNTFLHRRDGSIETDLNLIDLDNNEEIKSAILVSANWLWEHYIHFLNSYFTSPFPPAELMLLPRLINSSIVFDYVSWDSIALELLCFPSCLSSKFPILHICTLRSPLSL